MWLYLLGIAILASLSALEYRNPEPFLGGLFLYLYAAGVIWCCWRLAAGLILYRTVRQRGWEITFSQFFIGYHELAPLGYARVPRKEDWAALPASDPSRSEMQNLGDAMNLSRGWDAQLARRRRPVPIYTADTLELAHLAANLLREEGFSASVDDQSHGGSYRVSWGSRVLVAQEEKDAAEAFLHEALGGGDGESERDTTA